MQTLIFCYYHTISESFYFMTSIGHSMFINDVNYEMLDEDENSDMVSMGCFMLYHKPNELRSTLIHIVNKRYNQNCKLFVYGSDLLSIEVNEFEINNDAPNNGAISDPICSYDFSKIDND